MRPGHGDSFGITFTRIVESLLRHRPGAIGVAANDGTSCVWFGVYSSPALPGGGVGNRAGACAPDAKVVHRRMSAAAPSRPPWMPRALLLVAVSGLVGAFFAFGLHHALSLESLQSHRDELVQARDRNPLLFAGSYLLAYILMAALAIPGALVMTVAGGAVFGLLEGTVLASVLTPAGKDRILGVTIVAPRAGEMLSEMVLAMRHGIGLKQLFGTVHAYPTYTEANRDAAAAWRNRHAPTWLLGGLRRYHAWMPGGAGAPP